MPNPLRHNAAVFLCAVVLVVSSKHCAARPNACEANFAFQGSKGLKMVTLLQDFSNEQKVSVLAEILDGDPGNIEVPAGKYSLNSLVKMLNPALHCETVDGVLHLFDDRVVALQGNVLSHRFAAFRMPSNVDRFRNLLTGRLEKEAFAPLPKGRFVVQELGGGVSANADEFPLQIRVYRHIDARALIYAAAREHVLSSIIRFPRSDKGFTALEAWRFAASHWDWEVHN